MNIREGKEKINLLSLVFGGSKDDELYMYVLGATLGAWFAAMIIGSIVFLMNGTQMIYIETIVNALMIGAIAGFGLTVLSLAGNNDYNRTYGWGMWWRALIFNMLGFAIFYTIHTGATVDEHRESVKSFELVTSDIKDCEYMVKMESDSLVYNHCSSYDHTYKRIEESEDINAYLIGQLRYGSNVASHFEIVNKKIVKKVK